MAWPETVRKSDLEITWFSGTGAGGQHRNRHPNCCRMLHRPTGIRTTGQSHKSQEANKREAFRSLCDRLVPIMRKIARPERRVDGERIRTYHVPRATVTDHRLGSAFNLTRTLNGDLDPILRKLLEGGQS